MDDPFALIQQFGPVTGLTLFLIMKWATQSPLIGKLDKIITLLEALNEHKSEPNAVPSDNEPETAVREQSNRDIHSRISER